MSDSIADCVWVGIGASTGGLVALRELVASLPAQTGMAYIVVQNQKAEDAADLIELLHRETPLSVVAATEGVQPLPDHIYVVAPLTAVDVRDGTLVMEPRRLEGSGGSLVNQFFLSLAQQRHRLCAGILLAGEGADSTEGLRAIEAAGGLALAQSPESNFGGCSPASIKLDAMDRVVQLQEIPNLLRHYAENPDACREKQKGVEDQLGHIARLLKQSHDFDLAHYKPETIRRRVLRRVRLTGLRDFPSYVAKLSEDSQELRQLADDLMINVTNFFRDPQAFAYLEREVLPGIFAEIARYEVVRVWVPACATGEEVYSLAILLLEARAKARKKNDIRIFATDIDEHAIKVARKGVYPLSVASDLAQNRLEKYFKAVDDKHCQIRQQVRDLISFAAQNVASDPPFSYIHLISCRNLMIYLRKDVQEKVISAFHFALKNNGYLFLGSSETIGGRSESFKTVSKKWRVYRKLGVRDDHHMALEHISQRETAVEPLLGPRKEAAVSRSDLIRREMLETFLPPTVVVGQENQVLYNHGDLRAYTVVPSGEPTHDFFQIVQPSLRSRVRSAVFKARKSGEPVVFHQPVPGGRPNQLVRIEVSTLQSQSASAEPLVGIVFHGDSVPAASPPKHLTKEDDKRASEELERELAETKEELQNTIEELESSTEELKAAHEEALSTNEELQSANEEMEASAEELRSLNEELSTVNSQLKEKIEQVQCANNDLENFFSSADVATIFLDVDLHIQRTTAAAEELLRIGPRDLGKPIHALGRELIADLAGEARTALQKLEPVQREKQSYDGRWFVRRISLYRTDDRRIEGVVVVFQDITQVKLLSQRASAREQQQALVAKLGLQALSGVDPQELMHHAVRQLAYVLDADYCKVLRHEPEAHRLRIVAATGWNEDTVYKVTVPDQQDSQAGYTLLTSEPVIVSDINRAKRFTPSEFLRDYNVVSGMSCKIGDLESPFGVLTVHTRDHREFTQDDANAMQSVANLISAALRNKKAQAAVRESEERFKMAQTAAGIGIYDHDFHSGVLQWDANVRRIWGVSDGEPVSIATFEMGIHPDDRSRVKAAVDAAIAGETKDAFRLEYRVINRIDQSLLWVESTGRIVSTGDKPARLVGTVMDISARKRTALSLARSEQRLRLAKNSNRVGVFEYDISTGLIEWDQILVDIWGVEKGQRVTIDLFFKGLHPDDVEATRTALEASIDPAGGARYHSVYRVINMQTGEERWIEASGLTVFDSRQPVQMIGMVIDVTDTKRLEISLQEAISNLKMVDARKNEFLAILGHELRNPLSAVMGMVDVMDRKLPPPENLVPVMKNSLGVMARLLDDLLDISRISLGHIELKQRRVEIHDLLQKAVYATRASSEERRQRILVDVKNGVEVEGDPTRLEQIFANLLANASKFTPEQGTIEVTAEMTRSEVRIAVSDNGIGMDKGTLERVFDPFFQVPQEGHVSSGLGIGLALAKKLTELHGGTIRAYSDGKSKGATFEVCLPLAASRADAMVPEVPEVAVTPVPPPGLRVAVVEDNEDLLLAYDLLLVSLGCEVFTAGTAREGIELIRENNPAVALVDIGLPDMPGYEVAATLRAEGFDTLLVAVSGYSHSEARRKSEKAGFDHHLAKPANTDDIARVLVLAKETP